MSFELRELQDRSWISTLDRHFAEGMGRIGGEARPEVLLAAALTSRHVASGHVCLDLARVPCELEAAGWRADALPPPLDDWRESIRQSPIVSQAAGQTLSNPAAPLVIDAGDRLYLHRYWRMQERLAGQLRTRAEATPVELDPSLLREGVDRLFAAEALPAGAAGDARQGTLADAAREPDHQRIAAALAVMRQLSVISGGPGTGKTSTVARILALIVEQALAAGQGAPRITLAAPTGKAAATLADAIRRVVAQLDCSDEVKRAIPESAATIHRCLGLGASRSRRPRHHADNPIATDLLLVDEASMVDLVLMQSLVDAVPAGARLVLLGDEHQLASVEAGAILGDICDSDAAPGYSRDFATRLQDVTGESIETPEDADAAPAMRDCIARLTRSHRYGEGSGIAALSRAVKAGDAAAALGVLESGEFPDVSLAEPGHGGAPSSELGADIVEGYRGLFAAASPADQLAALSAFRVLSAVQGGPSGVEELNRLSWRLLRSEGLAADTEAQPSSGPIMITRNDYELELFNGDIGVLSNPAGEGLRAFFPAAGEEPRSVSIARLPAHVPAFVMTIHKSQGSEFDRVAVVLPEEGSAALSRELLYTAVTRARESVCIHATRSAVEAAVARRVDRSSALSEAIWAR